MAVAGWPVRVVALDESQSKVRATGLFSNMRWVEEAGDVVGTEVFIVYSTNGKNDYWALVQTAQGVPDPPVLVKAKIENDHVEISTPKSVGGRFVGRVTAKALVGRFERSASSMTLPRRKSYWQ